MKRMVRDEAVSGVAAAMWCVALIGGVAASAPFNWAASSAASASSQWTLDSPAWEATDERIEDDGRWVSANQSGPHWLRLDLPTLVTLGSYHLWSGIEFPRSNGEVFAIDTFELQWLDGATWRTIPGSAVSGNDEGAVAVEFDAPVSASSFRLWISDSGFARVREILLWEAIDGGGTPPIGEGIDKPSDLPDPTAHPILLNQIGYDTFGAKRFTAPLSADGSAFGVVETGSGSVVFSGVVSGGVGDFSALEPVVDDLEYEIRVSGDRSDGAPFDDGVSHPFEIGRMLLLRRVTKPALEFMIDVRSAVATHPSGSGGGAWRDGGYFTYETGSLALMQMAHPGYYRALPGEIDLAAEGAALLDPGYVFIRSFFDSDLPGTAETYHQTLAGGLDGGASDMSKLLHWGAGLLLLDPRYETPNGPFPENMIHAQTVGELAHVLYLYPSVSDEIDASFYLSLRSSVEQWWTQTGLFDVITYVGDFKGWEPPGHSVLSNLMMHGVAERDGLGNAQAYLDAAVAQAAWVVATFDPTNKDIAKGQRVTEHKLYTGLSMLLAEHPGAAPAGLDAWLDAWVDHAVAMSDNLYDFRRYDAESWTIPQPWNEPGNIAAFPGILSAIAGAGIDGAGDHSVGAHGGRLGELRASHWDNLFGRNPIGAATSGIPGSDFPGVETWWPRIYTGGAGWLDVCRGVVNSNAATEHYPFEFRMPYRHSEGWGAHNAGLNVSIAYLTRDAIEIGLLDAGGSPAAGGVPDVGFRVRLGAPFEPGMIGSAVSLRVNAGGVETELLATVDSPTSATTGLIHRGSLGLSAPGVSATVAYGVGFMSNELELAGACGADVASPMGVLDLADINAFVQGFVGGLPASDLNGDGVFDLADLNAFVSVFVAGCG
jgi:hypothetical protein